jgi:hypothetical protein
MAQLCAVTGNIADLGLEPVPNSTAILRPVREGTSVVVGGDVVTLARKPVDISDNGAVAFDAVTAAYFLDVATPTSFTSIRLGVPDAASAVLAAIANTTPPPPLDAAQIALQGAQEARDQAVEAAGEVAEAFDGLDEAIDAIGGIENLSSAVTSAANSATAAEQARLAAQTAAGEAQVAKITWRGDWATATAYEIRDAVYREGTSYIATATHTSGAASEPEDGVDWESFWDVLALRGAAGPGGGDVEGPASSVNNHIALFDGTSGKLLKGSGIAVADLATAAQGAKADTALQPGAQIPWTDVTGKPAFFSGAYADLSGIPATFAPSAHNQAWSTITSTPTTLAGYGITDAAPSSHVGAGGAAHPAASTTVAGFMAAADKVKLNGIAAGATANTGTVTSVSGTGTASGLTLSGTVTGSGNLTLSGTVTPAWADVTGKPTFATVATTGAYGDLTGIPATFAPSAHTHPASAISDSTTAGRDIVTAVDAAAQRSLLSVESTTQLNARDTANRARSNHTGAQAISTITGLQSALDGKQPLATVLTNTTAAFTTAQETKLAGIAAGATANSSDSALRDRSTHTGTQAASTITGLATVATSGAYGDLSGLPTLGGAAALNVGTTAGTVAAGNDNRMTNSREWTAATISQAEAEARTATTRRAWTAQRVGQAILAWWNGSADKSKLDGIATGATANASDAALRDRATHTGTQAISTVSGLQAELDNARAWALSLVTPYTLTDAEMALETIDPDIGVIFRRALVPGQVAPMDKVSSWRRNPDPGSQPSFSTAGPVSWTAGDVTQAEILSILTSVLDGAFNNPTFTGSVNIADGTAAAPAIRFTTDPDTGMYRSAADAIGFSAGGTRRALLSSTALQVDVPLTGTAVVSSNSDTTAGRVLTVGYQGWGAEAVTLPGSTNIKDRALMGGVYQYAASAVSGAPETLSYWHTLLALYHGTATRRAFLDIRTVGTNQIRGWLGANSSETGDIFWDRLVTYNSLLGTVTQDSGVPTGAVIQRGSNANGEFVRFADGTQICTFTPATGVACATTKGALFGNAATQTWTFPIAFADEPAVSGSGGGANRWLTLSPPTTTTVGWETLSHTSSATESAPTLTAIGRWF